jgi:hypothetical protein
LLGGVVHHPGSSMLCSTTDRHDMHAEAGGGDVCVCWGGWGG